MIHQADNLIISTAFDYSHVDPGVNVCKDVDVMYHTTWRPNYPNSSATCGLGCRYWQVAGFSGIVKGYHYFAPAFTDTDTTSAAYRRGKAQACNLLRKRPDLRAEVPRFYNKDASLDSGVNDLPGRTEMAMCAISS